MLCVYVASCRPQSKAYVMVVHNARKEMTSQLIWHRDNEQKKGFVLLCSFFLTFSPSLQQNGDNNTTSLLHYQLCWETLFPDRRLTLFCQLVLLLACQEIANNGQKLYLVTKFDVPLTLFAFFLLWILFNGRMKRCGPGVKCECTGLLSNEDFKTWELLRHSCFDTLKSE